MCGDKAKERQPDPRMMSDIRSRRRELQLEAKNLDKMMSLIQQRRQGMQEDLVELKEEEDSEDQEIEELAARAAEEEKEMTMMEA